MEHAPVVQREDFAAGDLPSCLIVIDNRTGLTSNAILKSKEEYNVEWHYIACRNPKTVSTGSMVASPSQAMQRKKLKF